jgi:hypothetical protein
VPDSLVIGNIIELLGGGVPSTHPQCQGAMFRLAPGWDMSSPQYAADTVATLLLGGGLPIGQHVDNRKPKFPIVIQVPSTGVIDNDRATLAGAREVLTQAVSADRWVLEWTREGGMTLVFDCFHADPVIVTHSLPQDEGLISQIEVTFQAMPYGRSDSVELIPFNSPSTGWVAPPASVTVDDYSTIANWLTGDSASFEGSAGTWVGLTNATVARSTAQFHGGAASLAITATALGNAVAAACAAGSAATLGMPCLAGDSVNVGGWFRAATTARTIQPGAQFYDYTGTAIGTPVYAAGAADVTTGWTNITGAVTAPAGAAYAIDVSQVVSAAAAEVHYQDDMSINRGAIFSLVNLNQFVQSSVVAFGGHCLRWLRTTHDSPDYKHPLPAPLNIYGLTRISVWVGLGTNTYSQWHHGRATLAITLTDATGLTVTTTITATVRASGLITAPYWQKVSGLLPQNTSFDYTNVVSYELTCWNRVETGGNQVLQAEAYFDTLRADAPATGAPGPRGAVYFLPGVIGTAPAALTFQLQPGPSTAQQTALFTTSGSNNWTAPAGVTNVQKAEAWAAGGGGGSAGADGAGGGGGGEYACEYNIPVTALSVYQAVVGNGGLGGVTGSNHAGTYGGNSSFLGNGGFGVLAHGGQPGGIGSSHADGDGGTGSSNSVHFSGGEGQDISTGEPRGGGGGGSGGTGSPGRDGGPSGEPVYQGAPPVTGGGPGGNGGEYTILPHAGQRASTGPGGGGGGGAIGSGGMSYGGGGGRDGQVRLTWSAVAAAALKTAVVHLPPRDAPSSIAPFIATGNGTDTPNGGTVYSAPLTGTQQARYRGVYQVILTNSVWNTPTATRTVTLTVQQHKADGTTVSTQLTRSFIPNTDPDHVNILNGLVLMGVVVLPLSPISPGNNTDVIQITVNDTNTADRFLDTLLLDTTGQTVVYSSSASGVNNLWVTEPDIGLDFGYVYGSQADWDQAGSVMGDCVVMSGGPMAAMPGDNPLLVYSVQGAPAVQASYQPRWLLERLQ